MNTLQTLIEYGYDNKIPTGRELKQAAAELAVLQARLSAAEQLITQLRNGAKDKYIQTYNKGKGEGYLVAADLLEEVLQPKAEA